MLAAGPTVTVHGWATVLLTLGAVATAITAIGMFAAKVALPMMQMVVEVVKDYPIVRDIAERFGSEDGQELISAELRAIVATQQTSADIQRAMLDRLEVVSTKLSETRHAIIGKFTSLPVVMQGATNIVEALENVASDLKSVHADLERLAARLPPD